PEADNPGGERWLAGLLRLRHRADDFIGSVAGAPICGGWRRLAGLFYGTIPAWSVARARPGSGGQPTSPSSSTTRRFSVGRSPAQSPWGRASTANAGL